MKKKLIIFGTTYFSEMLMYYVEKYDNAEVIAFTADEQYITSDVIFDRPAVGFECLDKEFDMENISVMLGIGYNNMNGLRQKKFQEIKKHGYKIESFIHPSVHMEKCKFGEGNIMLENVSIGYSVNIGDCNIFWNGSNISHHCTIGNYNFFAPSSVLAGKVKVRDNCFFGINVTVRGGITIEDRTLAGAGAYISKDTCQGSVYVPEKSKCLVGKTSKDFL